MEQTTLTHSLETGVIYLITNRLNGKMYVGRTTSFEKHGSHPPTPYCGKGRLRRHISNALSNREKASTDCRVLYDAIRAHGPDAFIVEDLCIALIPELKKLETLEIQRRNTCNPDVGYNYFVGDNKPTDETYLTQYKQMKQTSNKSRAVDGHLKKNPHSIGLPPNISPLMRNGVHVGYSASIKIDGEDFFKSFGRASNTMEEKLQMTKDALEAFKQKHSVQ